MQSHRVHAPVWQTTAIEEAGDEVRITVSTPHPEDAREVAGRIVNARRSQSWRIIEVHVLDASGEAREVLRSEHPHPAATLRDDDVL